MSDPISEKNAFVLSRIHGQGWNAARKLLAMSAGEITATQAAAANPYSGGEKRMRWEKGFMEALASSTSRTNNPGAHLRRGRIATTGPAGSIADDE